MRKSILILFLLLCSACRADVYTVGVVTDSHTDTTDPTPMAIFGDRTPFWSDAIRVPLSNTTSISDSIVTFNAASVDIIVNMGDAINGGTIGAVRNANFAAFVAAVGAADAPIYSALGHWDAGTTSIVTADYDAFFHNDGMGTLIPTAGDAAEDVWTPDTATAGDECAYVIPHATFKIIVLCAVLGDVDMTSSGTAAQTQQQWFQDRLDEAEAASELVIVFIHMPLRSDAVNAAGNSAPGTVTGAATAITSLEAQTIMPIVFQGHVHYYQDTFDENGVRYFNMKGDVWGVNSSDIGRQSHSVVEITYPAYTDINGPRALVKITGQGHQKSEDLSQVLVAHWKLDETNGTAAAGDAIKDNSGNAYHGTNSETVVSVSAPIGHGLSLDGTGDYIDDTANPILGFPCSFSIWYRTASTQSKTLFGISLKSVDGVNVRFMELQLNSGIPRIEMKGGAAPIVNVPQGATARLNEWVHLVVVWTSAARRDLYVNGKLETTSTTSTAATVFPTTTDTITIGARSENNSQEDLFTGDLSDVRMYSGALLASDISSLYRGGTVSRRHRQSSKKNDGFARTRN